MPDVTRRRHLVQEDKDDFDCCLTFDVNEYLIDNWPTLTFRNRQSVWSICQNDDEFDWDVVEDQIIDCIYDLAEQDSTVVLPEEDDSEEEDDEDSDDEFYDDVISSVSNYIEYFYDEMEEESEDFASFVIDKLDDLLSEYYESEDEDEEETTES